MSKTPIKEPKDCNPPFEWTNLATELVKELKELAKCRCKNKKEYTIKTCPLCLGTGYISYDDLMKKIFKQ